MRRTLTLIVALAAPLSAQTRTLPPAVRTYVSVDAPVVAITPVKPDQTILIRGDKIASVGPSASVTAPEDARVIDGTGKTVIPGLIGLHDHMYYGGMQFMGVSYPRLFLGAGVTTIRTTGSVDSYQELNLKRRIDSLLTPGPNVVVTGPYLQGSGVGPGAM